MVQEKYARAIVAKFQMEDAKFSALPLDPVVKLSVKQCPSSDQEKEEMLEKPYRSLVESLMYLTTWTRPDLAVVVSELSRFSSNPGKVHWEAAKRVVRYVHKTAKEGIVYQRGEQVAAWEYSDASYGTCPNIMRSRSGYVF